MPPRHKVQMWEDGKLVVKTYVWRPQCSFSCTLCIHNMSVQRHTPVDGEPGKFRVVADPRRGYLICNRDEFGIK